MKNLHLEHPEDSVLNGDLSVLNWFTSDGNVSVKIDGSPAIVWGRNPSTGNFFVGTKSVFNKIKIKINESHQQIDNNHQGKVAEILHHCLDYLPRTDNIYQGDFIGFGGDSTYCANTITYKFPEIIDTEIIIAPHTEYFAAKDLRDAVSQPIQSRLNDTLDVVFIQPKVRISPHLDDIQDICNFAKQIATMCEFPEQSIVNKLKKQINTCIREGLEVDDLTLDSLAHYNSIDINVLRLWKLVETIKMDMFCYLHPDDDLECTIEGRNVDHEGYVMSNKFGTFKIVDRRTFSYHNFNRARY
tara:strand:+ start:597 stop:1496 length:900 start_codon:yes stop_codon:yes gene_type:complete